MATITAVIVEADGTVRKAEVENSVGGFQAVVGGYFRPILHRDFTVYVNEDGYSLSLPTNRRIGEVIDYPYPLVGAALIVGPADDGSDTDVPASIISHYELEQ